MIAKTTLQRVKKILIANNLGRNCGKMLFTSLVKLKVERNFGNNCLADTIIMRIFAL